MNVLKLILVLAFSISISACSSTYNLPKPPNIYNNQAPYPSKNVGPDKQSAISEILYVTDRGPKKLEDGSLKYTDERSQILRYGVGRVKIGENKSWSDIVAAANSDIERIKLEETLHSISPESEFPSTPLLFKVVNGVGAIDPEQLRAYEAAREDFQGFVREALSSSAKKEVVVFIHGFNTSFEEALFVTNDIYHYTGRSVVPIAYTWPSDNGNLFGYFHDQGSAEYTIYHLKEFFRSLMAMPEIDRIHVIAHSLGTQATTSAFRELLIETRASGKNARETFKIANLIMAAPDIDYGVATQRLIAERFAAGFERVTVYTNPKDKALSISGLLQSGLRFGKLLPSEEGEPQREIFEQVRNVNFIQLNSSTAGFTNHGYFTKNPAALSDVITLINNPSDPGTAARPLRNVGGNFWELDKGYLKPSPEALNIVDQSASPVAACSEENPCGK